jgi:hypothetical protein
LPPYSDASPLLLITLGTPPAAAYILNTFQVPVTRLPPWHEISSLEGGFKSKCVEQSHWAADFDI